MITDQAIRDLRADATAARNTGLARLCSQALTGDADARARVAGIIATGKDPQAAPPMTEAQRKAITDMGMDPDEIERSMNARWAEPR